MTRDRSRGRGSEDHDPVYELTVNGVARDPQPRQEALRHADAEGRKGASVTVRKLRPGKHALVVMTWSNGRKYT